MSAVCNARSLHFRFVTYFIFFVRSLCEYRRFWYLKMATIYRHNIFSRFPYKHLQQSQFTTAHRCKRKKKRRREGAREWATVKTVNFGCTVYKTHSSIIQDYDGNEMKWNICYKKYAKMMLKAKIKKIRSGNFICTLKQNKKTWNYFRNSELELESKLWCDKYNKNWVSLGNKVIWKVFNGAIEYSHFGYFRSAWEKVLQSIEWFCHSIRYAICDMRTRCVFHPSIKHTFPFE